MVQDIEPVCPQPCKSGENLALQQQLHMVFLKLCIYNTFWDGNSGPLLWLLMDFGDSAQVDSCGLMDMVLSVTVGFSCWPSWLSPAAHAAIIAGKAC